MCLPWREDTGRYRSVIHPFLSDLLTIVRLTSLFLSLLPALPPPLLSLSLLHSHPVRSVCWALKFWQVKDVLFSSAIAQAHTRRHTQTHLQYTRACVLNSICVALCRCCRPLAEWDKLSGSHFSEWISIVVCYCPVCVCVLIDCICVSLCHM